jgi:hypothetical protein
MTCLRDIAGPRRPFPRPARGRLPADYIRLDHESATKAPNLQVTDALTDAITPGGRQNQTGRLRFRRQADRRMVRLWHWWCKDPYRMGYDSIKTALEISKAEKGGGERRYGPTSLPKRT